MVGKLGAAQCRRSRLIAIEGEWLAGLLFAGYTAFVLWLWLRDDDDDSRD